MERVEYNHTPEAVPHDEPSALNAAERAIDAGQRIIVERMELLRLETQDAATRLVREAAVVIAGSVLAFAGWCVLMVMAVQLLQRWLVPEASLAIVGGVHLIAGLALVAYGVARTPGRERT